MKHEKLTTITTRAGVAQLKAYLQGDDKLYIAVDSETTGVSKDAQVVGFSVCADPEEAFYVVLAYWDVPKQTLVWLETKDVAVDFFNFLLTKQLIMHNSPFDCEKINSDYGVELMPAVHTDTMALAHLLDENRRVGLKELGAFEFGQSAKTEHEEMKASVLKNGGIWEEKKKDANKEMYKADMEILAKYGAKDALLTYNLFLLYVPRLFEQKLDQFFYEDETMPLMRGPTYQMNTVGLKVDMDRIQKLQKELEQETTMLKAEVYEAIFNYVKEKYPGTKPKNTFNLGASQQLSWLLYCKLGNEFRKLTETGRLIAKEALGRLPYTKGHKRDFIATLTEQGKNPYKYMKCDKITLIDFALKYSWIAKLLEYRRLEKLLKTYVVGIQRQVRYGIINPGFLQHGTTSGRYASRSPNFQNLPRDDKRVKNCIVARPGLVFVGADESQLEPRVFASFAQDRRLLESFHKNEDFYSVVGIPIFHKFECTPFKEDNNGFAIKFPALRHIAKVIALATPYGNTAFRMAESLRDDEGNRLSPEQCQAIIDAYFKAYPQVEQLMLDSHEQMRTNGVVYNLFGRPRRVPDAKKITRMFKGVPYSELPYEYRKMLNLGMNHRIQSTAASIVNRAAIAIVSSFDRLGLDAKIVLQVHDEIVVECLEGQAKQVADIVKDAMENTVKLPGVALIAIPKVVKSLGELK